MKFIVKFMFIFLTICSIGCDFSDTATDSSQNDQAEEIKNFSVINNFDASQLELPEGNTFRKAITVKGETIVISSTESVKETDLIPSGIVVNGTVLKSQAVSTKALADGDILVNRSIFTPSGSQEMYIKLPADCYFTGIGAGVRDSNFKRLRYTFKRMQYNETSGLLEFSGNITYDIGSYELERYTQINSEIQQISVNEIPYLRFEVVTGVGGRITDSNVVMWHLVTNEVFYRINNDDFWFTDNVYSYTATNVKYSGTQAAFSGTEAFYYKSTSYPYHLLTAVGFRSTDSNLQYPWADLSEFRKQYRPE